MTCPIHPTLVAMVLPPLWPGRCSCLGRGNALLGAMPWVAVLIGGALILLVLWMLAGRSLYFSGFELFASRISDTTNVSTRGFSLFGLLWSGFVLAGAHIVFYWSSLNQGSPPG